tara:strand:- start:342 stop:506 length:165 start_codon:yes stop_codon:yes gene_type:complete
MTRQFNTDMERDINRIAIATEKILKLLKEDDGQLSDIRNMLGCLAVKQQKEEKK